MKHIDIIETIKLVSAGAMTRKEAAKLLGYSIRQIGRKVKRFKEGGPKGLLHGNANKPSNNKMPSDVEAHIVKILSTKLDGFDPTHATEMLAKEYKIHTNRETLRQIMIRYNLWHPSKVERLKYGWRERKPYFGELLQGDGSYHIWFGNEYSTLVAFIDDATSTVELMFAEQETIESMSELLKNWLHKYGRPVGLYTDRGKVFKMNNAKDDAPRETQFQRMNRELNIEITHARTPQAKGRVERLFRTLQQRLVQELKFYNITTMEEANLFLRNKFQKAFNQQFSNIPRKKADLHRPLLDIDLKSIFCYKENRILKRDRTIRFKNRWFFLAKKQPLQLYPGCKVTVCSEFNNGAIWLTYKDKRLSCKEITEPRKTKRKEKPKMVSNKLHKPSENHPWREPGRWK